MNNLKKRRESVATVCRKTTKFLTSNTANLLKKVPNTRKYRLLAKLVEESEGNEDSDVNKYEDNTKDDEEEDLDDRELDYYLGVRKKETCWRDLAGREQITKDFLLYHCGISEEDYDRLYKKATTRKVSFKQPKLKQVPFKITRKKHRRSSLEGDSWREKSGIFKLFNRRDSETTSDSYSECDSSDDSIEANRVMENNEENWGLFDDFNDYSQSFLEGVRIKEVSEGRPCDNCPELCPGFISHPWRGDNRKRKSAAQAIQSSTREDMCLAMKQLEWAELYRRLVKTELKEQQPERKIQKFPSRERNYAVRRKNNNNNFRSHANCETCARVAAQENR